MAVESSQQKTPVLFKYLLVYVYKKICMQKINTLSLIYPVPYLPCPLTLLFLTTFALPLLPFLVQEFFLTLEIVYIIKGNIDWLPLSLAFDF